MINPLSTYKDTIPSPKQIPEKSVPMFGTFKQKLYESQNLVLLPKELKEESKETTQRNRLPAINEINNDFKSINGMSIKTSGSINMVLQFFRLCSITNLILIFIL